MVSERFSPEKTGRTSGTTVDNTNSSDEEEKVDDRNVCGVKLQAAEFEHLLCPFVDDDDENVDTTGKNYESNSVKHFYSENIKMLWR